jgi:hypothetical protein
MDQYVTRTEIEALHERISDMKQRLTVVETDLPYIRASVERTEAVMSKRFDRIDGTVTWAARVISAGVLAAVVAFVLKGGLFLG